MKNFFVFLTTALLMTLAGTKVNAQAVDLSKYTRITDLSELEDGETYFIVNDRVKYNYNTGGDGGTDGDATFTKAMANYQSGFTATCWDNATNNIYFVYYGDLNVNSQGFVWKAEKVGDKWAFKNMELNKYLGNHNSGETDLRFSDTAIGYTLTKQPTHDGSYGFSFTNDSYLTDWPSDAYLNVHQYDIRKSRGVLSKAAYSDANASDAAENGYPGRWCLYKTTVPDAPPTVEERMGLLRINRTSDLVEGEEYYIVSDRTGYAGNSTDLPKAMSTQQSSYTTKWGTQYVYWGDINTDEDGFVWTVEEMPGNMWAFKNKENGKYLGNMNTSPAETDVVFSDTPIGYTLTDLAEGAGKFTFINEESEYTLHVQGYLRDRANNSLAKQANGNDDYSADVATKGYPGRWHIYVKGTTQLKSISDVKDGTTYYIVSDRKKYAASSSQSLRAMSTHQSNYTVNWGDQYVYWGEMDKNEDGYKWTAEQVGDQWAFKNVENGKYLGNMNQPTETDVIFSDTPIGYTLTDLKVGLGKFNIVSDEDSHSLHVQGYLRSDRATNSVAKNYVGDDTYSDDVDTYGYPARWRLYEVNTVDKGEEPVYDKYHFDTINVVSYNVKHCEGQDGMLNVQRTANAIKALNPTVAVLQEVDMVYGERSNYENQLLRLAELTGMYGRSTPGENFGTAILSKEKPISFHSVDLGEGCPMPVIELQDYVVGCVHIALTVSAREKAGPKILAEAQAWQAKGKPFIVAGDFNDDGTESEMQGQWGILTKYLQEHNFTFHSDMVTPTWGEGTYVIDHIASYAGIGGVKTLSYQVIDDKITSDHLPIMAKLRVGFPKELTPEEVRAIIADSIASGHTTIDMSDMAYNADVTAGDLTASGNVIVITPSTSTLSGTNIISNGACQSLVLTDGESYAPKKAFTATSAIYERTMANEWGTICLPYEVSSNDEVEYYTISGIENDVLQVTKLATLPAGTPALMRKVSGTGITATASNVSVLTAPGAGTSTAVEMYGTFQQGVEVTDANAYYIKNNKFWQCNTRFYCDAFRAYFKINGSGSPTFRINISDDDVTGVSSAMDDKEATVVAIYAPDGTRRTALQQGVNIVKLSNGKTVKTVKR